ncbi:MAG: SH3 domain-containing protein [Clostridiales bacterium]|nr:SH3 domain-containing protein [Clostridiales bacterium]
MRKKHVWFWMALVVILGVSFVTAAMAESRVPTAVIDGNDASRVHLRLEPSQSAASLGLFFTGTEVNWLGEFDEQWAQVEIGSQRGFMMKKYLYIGTEPQLVVSCQPRGVLKDDTQDIPVWYAHPVSGQADGWINGNAVLTVLGETVDGFYYVEAAGLPLYVDADAIQLVERSAAPAVRASRLYWQVLCDRIPYRAAVTGQDVFLSQYNPEVEDIGHCIGRYAIVDLDQDTEMEAAVEVLAGGYPFCYLLLDERGGMVYGYEMPARGLMELKTDGTATWANGAGNTGFGWRDDWNGDSATGTIALCDWQDDQQIFVVNGERTSPEAFQEALRQQELKPNAVWYWPEENQESLLFE